MKTNMDAPSSFGKVTKTLAPLHPGTLKLARRYGPMLVCVRYREDPINSKRLTTVELIVDEWPLVRRADPLVKVRLPYDEEGLRRRARALGAEWNHKERVWTMPKSIARLLKLSRRVIDEKGP